MAEALPLFSGTFNWYGELHNMYCRAESREQAFRFFCKRLSDKLGYKTSNTVRHYFYDTDKYMIREEKKKEDGKENKCTGCPHYSGGEKD